MIWNEKKIILENAVKLLRTVATTMEGKISPPIYKNYGYVFEQPDASQFLFLRSIRIISSINAILILLEQGYTQEVCALQRGVNEFIDEIFFMLKDVEENDYDQKQKDFIKKYFETTVDTVVQLAQNPDLKPPIWFKKKNIFERLATRKHNKKKTIKEKELRMRCLDHGIFSSYVHGLYPAIMELYQLDQSGVGKFRLMGTSCNSNIIDVCRQNVIDMVHTSIIAIASVTSLFQLRSESKLLLQKYAEIDNLKISRLDLKKLKPLIQKTIDNFNI